MKLHCSEAKFRLNPGAIFCPIKAASMGIVPEPQKGSMNVSSGRQFVNIISAAANVSLRGASPRSEEHTLNSSHVSISYAVFCLKKKKQQAEPRTDRRRRYSVTQE